MMKKIILLVVLVLALTACETRVIMEQPGQEQRNAITVQGSTEFEAAPDLAKIRFRLQTEAPNAQQAQLQNREIAANVEAALKKAGVRANDIETTDYRVEKIRQWDSKLERTVDRGYRVSNAFIVSTKDLQSVGTLLDAGVQAGANNVDSISFELSDELESETKTEALTKATRNAKEKAQAMATGAGVRLGKVISISESSYGISPYPMPAMAEMRMDMAESMPETSISPQSVRVSAQVSVSYDIV